MAEPSFLQVLTSAVTRSKATGTLSSADGGRGWWPLIREPSTGAWQRSEDVRVDTALSNPVLFRCISLIASDIAKLRCRLMALNEEGVWVETESPAFSPVLRRPNRYQNRIQFFASWMQSKLAFGNTYVLKGRDARGVVTALHVLDPGRVTPLVAPDGQVYYRLRRDDLSGVAQDLDAIPASEIIHDRWNTLFHPLVGLSPIYACGLAALQAQEIQNSSVKFFRNGSKPGGVLTAPAAIDDATAQRLKAHWETNYGGDNTGKVAVLGDGLKYEGMAVNAKDSQLIDQLKWDSETVCGTLGVPSYMAGVGPAPLNNNVQSLNEHYYSQCLQIHFESIEACLDDGLGIGYGTNTGGVTYGTEFDLDDLLRMDTATQVKTLGEAVTGGLMKPDEGRRKLGLGKVKGGDAVYLQQQNFSLEALAKRDARDDPFGTASAADPAPAPAPAANDDTAAQALAALAEIRKGFR